MDHHGLVAFVVSLLLGGVAFLIVERLLPGFKIRGGFGSAVLVSFVYGVIKALLWWLLVIVSFPLVAITLGLFIFVINAFLLWITDKLVRRLEVRSFSTLIVAAVLLSVLDYLFGVILHVGAVF